MRIIITLFSFYLLFLAVIPCCTNEPCDDETNQAGQSVPVDQNDDCGTCSPFVTCGNCCGFVQIAKQIELSEFDNQKPEHYTAITSLIPSSFIALVLQPPRLF